tara:strand:- start:2272 stop:2448 length:177 start_codon:yes stop_codon:yes gene_type:complete
MKYVNTRNTPCIVRVNGEIKVLQPGDEVMSEQCLLQYGLEAIVVKSPKKSTKKKTTKK